MQVDLGEIGLDNLDAGELAVAEELSELHGVGRLGVE